MSSSNKIVQVRIADNNVGNMSPRVWLNYLAGSSSDLPSEASEPTESSRDAASLATTRVDTVDSSAPCTPPGLGTKQVVVNIVVGQKTPPKVEVVTPPSKKQADVPLAAAVDDSPGGDSDGYRQTTLNESMQKEEVDWDEAKRKLTDLLRNGHVRGLFASNLFHDREGWYSMTYVTWALMLKRWVVVWIVENDFKRGKPRFEMRTKDDGIVEVRASFKRRIGE